METDHRLTARRQRYEETYRNVEAGVNVNIDNTPLKGVRLGLRVKARLASKSPRPAAEGLPRPQVDGLVRDWGLQYRIGYDSADQLAQSVARRMPDLSESELRTILLELMRRYEVPEEKALEAAEVCIEAKEHARHTATRLSRAAVPHTAIPPHRTSSPSSPSPSSPCCGANSPTTPGLSETSRPRRMLEGQGVVEAML